MSELVEGDHDWTVNNGAVAMEAVMWFLDKCRAAGATEWYMVEQILWSKPGCTVKIVEAIRAGWEMGM